MIAAALKLDIERYAAGMHRTNALYVGAATGRLTPEIVGCTSGVFISNRIAYHISSSLNWGLAAALGSILLALVPLNSTYASSRTTRHGSFSSSSRSSSMAALRKGLRD